MESKRKFLTDFDCLEELLILEEESGNFNEAAFVAKKIGDFLHEIDLLAEIQDFSSASTLMISYVLCNSLWGCDGQGWPLKSFPQKEELLNKAKSFSKKVSVSFHAAVCTEAKILSHGKNNLIELMDSYVDSKGHQNRMGEILSVRKILDFHLQVLPAEYELEPTLWVDPTIEKIPKNKVSVVTLAEFWNLFKKNALEILECVDYIERVEFDECDEFCFCYFGVRFDKTSSSFILMNPDAKWVKTIDQSFLLKKRKMVCIHARHFASAVRKYWRQELLSLGLWVLGTLQSIYNRSSDKPFSRYCQSTCLTWIFDISKFFIESNSFDIKKNDANKLHAFVQLSSNYFEIAFFSNPQHSLSEDMVSLRQTELSKNLLEEVMLRNISGRGELTYGQMGRVVMIWLGSGKPKRDLCDKIVKKFPQNSSWKTFIEILIASEESPSEVFYKALAETYSANFRTMDYISPHCFLYLVERFLILLPHSRGFFFATKSSIVEWLVCQESDARPMKSLGTFSEPSFANFSHSVLNMIQQFLYDIHDMREWVSRSKIDPGYYYPVLIVRLIVILCLLCLNSEISFSIVHKCLGLNHVRSNLPKQFCEALRRRNKNCNLYTAAVAEAFKAVGDPLVIVALRENVKFASENAGFLDMTSFSCKKDVMSVLFPRISGEDNVTKSSIERETQETGSNLGSKNVAESSTEIENQETSLYANVENVKGKLQLSRGVLQEINDMLVTPGDTSDGNVKISILKKKLEEVGDHENFLSAAVSHLSEQKLPISAEDESVLCEADNMIEGLKKLSSSLNTSKLDSNNSSEVGEFLKILELHLLSNPSVMRNETSKSSVVSSEVNEEKVSNNYDDSENVIKLTKQCAESSQGKQKKNNNKNRKKGGKGKRKN